MVPENWQPGLGTERPVLRLEEGPLELMSAPCKSSGIAASLTGLGFRVAPDSPLRGVGIVPNHITGTLFNTRAEIPPGLTRGLKPERQATPLLPGLSTRMPTARLWGSAVLMKPVRSEELVSRAPPVPALPLHQLWQVPRWFFRGLFTGYPCIGAYAV